MQRRLSQIQSDIFNQQSFPHTNNSVYIVKFMLFGRLWTSLAHFFVGVISLHCLMYNDMWQSAVIALLHIEHTILVFQRRTLLHPFPHINLSRVLFLPLRSYVPRLWLICLRPSCDKILQISLPTYLELHSPYYFPKVVWSLSLDYSIPLMPHISRPHSNVFFSLQE